MFASSSSSLLCWSHAFTIMMMVILQMTAFSIQFKQRKKNLLFSSIHPSSLMMTLVEGKNLFIFCFFIIKMSINTVNSNVFPVNQTRWTIFILFTVCVDVQCDHYLLLFLLLMKDFFYVAHLPNMDRFTGSFILFVEQWQETPEKKSTERK